MENPVEWPVLWEMERREARTPLGVRVDLLVRSHRRVPLRLNELDDQLLSMEAKRARHACSIESAPSNLKSTGMRLR